MKPMIVTAWCRMVQDADLVLQLCNLRNTSIVDTDLFFVFFFFLNKLIPTLDVALQLIICMEQASLPCETETLETD